MSFTELLKTPRVSYFLYFIIKTKSQEFVRAVKKIYLWWKFYLANPTNELNLLMNPTNELTLCTLFNLLTNSRYSRYSTYSRIPLTLYIYKSLEFLKRDWMSSLPPIWQASVSLRKYSIGGILLCVRCVCVLVVCVCVLCVCVWNEYVYIMGFLFFMYVCMYVCMHIHISS